MKDDYLWDRSGEPDPDIQKLENILGTLSHQPRPLQIPGSLQTGRHQFFFRSLAIAAAIAIIVLAVGVWVNWQKQPASQKAAAGATDEKKVNGLLAAGTPEPKPDKLVAPEPRPTVTAHKSRPRALPVKRSKLPASEIAKAQAAKDDLMLALRLASSKLNFAQRKTQGVSPVNQIHNQHKTG